MSPNASRRWLIAVLALAALLRLGHLYAVADEPFVATLIVDSREYDRWAQEIAAGDWLGQGAFFQAPLYPYLLAALYATLGHHLLAVYLAQIAGAIVGCWALFRAGQLIGGARLGLAAAGLAACYGPFVFYDALVLKESFAVTSAALLLLALTQAREGQRGRHWFLAGGWLGVLALLRENALLLALPLGFLAMRRPCWWRAQLRNAAFFWLGFGALLLPVALRNAWVGGGFLPTTFQGGVNLYIGNNPKADGTYQPLVPGRQLPALEAREATRLAERAVGERLMPAQVSSYWVHRVVDWAAREPQAFLRLQLRKLRLYWSWYEWPDAVDYYDFRMRSPVLRLPLVEFGAVTSLAGLALVLLLLPARANPLPDPASRRALLPAIVFATLWMFATITFFLFSRYRLPAVPALMLLAGVAVVRLWEWRHRRGGAVLGLACLAAFAAPHLAGYAPRLDLVHGNLARLAEEAGSSEEARRHYRQVLAVAPGDLGALLGLGAHAARAKDWATALEHFREAARVAPESDDAAASLGGVYVVLGRWQEAEAELLRALSLDAENPLAQRNLETLRRKLQAAPEVLKDASSSARSVAPSENPTY